MLNSKVGGFGWNKKFRIVANLGAENKHLGGKNAEIGAIPQKLLETKNFLESTHTKNVWH